MNTSQNTNPEQSGNTAPSIKEPEIQVISRRNFLAAASLQTAGLYIASSAALAQASPDTAVKATTSLPTPASDVVTDQDREFMHQAIYQMRKAGVIDKTGGPFGAVIVLDGKVIAATGNSVIRDNDPSAHAEVNAIRAACRKLGRPDLTGAVLYTSCQTCPMCYATAYWARIEKIYYAAAWSDYDDLFDDSAISQDMEKQYPQRKLVPQQLLQAEAQKVWQEFRQLPDGARY